MPEKEKQLNIKVIKKIIAMMGKQGITELDIEQEGIKVHLKRGAGIPEGPQTVISSSIVSPQSVQPVAALAAIPAAPLAAAPVAEPTDEEKGLTAVTSPMVG